MSEFRKLTIREVQLKELDILKDAVRWFEEHNVNYFLAGGSMLGAVRHNGFIPWDDDIDVLVPRMDYEKIKRLAAADRHIGKSEIRMPGDNKFPYSYMKIINRNYKVVDDRHNESISVYLWIDIFPLDHFPDEDNLHRRYLRHIGLLNRIIAAGTLTKEYMESRGYFSSYIKYLEYKGARLCYRMMGGYKKITIKVDAVASAMNMKYIHSKHYGDGAFPNGMKDYFSEDQVKPLVKHNFEGLELFIPQNYDGYLTQFYGDYMKLPPVEERQTHYIDVYEEIDKETGVEQ